MRRAPRLFAAGGFLVALGLVVAGCTSNDNGGVITGTTPPSVTTVTTLPAATSTSTTLPGATLPSS